jgi:hypothetical protein
VAFISLTPLGFQSRKCVYLQGKFVLHTVQLLPKKVVKTMENFKMFALPENGEVCASLPVKGSSIVHFMLLPDLFGDVNEKSKL